VENLTLPERIERLRQRGYRPVSLDRILGMRIGTTQGWADGVEVTPEAVALISMVETYPWILRAADGGFTEEAAVEAMLGGLAVEVRQSLAEGKGQLFGVQGPNTSGEGSCSSVKLS